MTTSSIVKMKEEQHQYHKTGFGRWSWWLMIDTLAQGDITKFEAITDLNFIMCLNQLSFLKEKAAEDRRISELNKQQH